MREILPLNNITGVTAGGTASLSLPVNATYEKLHLAFTGVTAAQIKNVKVEINGRTLTEYATLEDLLKENAYFKREKLAGYATMHFARPEVRSPMKPDLVVERFFGLGTAGIKLCQIKFDIDQAATTPVIKAFCEKAAPTPPSWLFKRRTFRMNLVEGINEIADLPRPVGAYIALIEIKHPNIKTSEFLVNNIKWRDNIPKALHDHILKQNGRTPQTGIHAIDLMLDGDVFGGLMLDPLINDMRLRLDVGETAQAEVIVHYFDDYAKSSF